VVWSLSGFHSKSGTTIDSDVPEPVHFEIALALRGSPSPLPDLLPSRPVAIPLPGETITPHPPRSLQTGPGMQRGEEPSLGGVRALRRLSTASGLRKLVKSLHWGASGPFAGCRRPAGCASWGSLWSATPPVPPETASICWSGLWRAFKWASGAGRGGPTPRPAPGAGRGGRR